MRFKRAVREFVDRTPIFEQIFIYLYKIFGSRPWSLGYSIYKFKEIADTIERKLNIFNASQLPFRYGFGIDERIVEYPWFFSQLKENEEMLLDAGGTLNHSKILKLSKLKDRRLYILTLHPEGEYNKSPFPTYKYEDLRKISYADDFFDAVMCISTLEHVGMDNSFIYTPDKSKNENDKYAFLDAINELKRVLKKRGTLYLTVPYGKYKNHKWFQVFDAEMVTKLKEVFSPSNICETYFRYEHKQ
ncbi:MAG: methyltransferase domain-containing protein, partial [Candidatus Heimdallarchaeota archaeon]|nr:methyltransferase domain-containing protein [Candidatus Heimdallarchaeota archaeon]